MAQPTFYNLNSLIGDNPLVFGDLNNFRSYQEWGLRYVSDKRAIFEKFAAPMTGQTVRLVFDLQAIEELRKKSEMSISVNDLIHAIFFKIIIFNSSLPSDQEVLVAYACDMRRRCGLGENYIGNLINTGHMVKTKAEIQHASLLELAQMNRKSLTEINPEKFKKKLSWFDYFSKFNESVEDYFPLNCIDPCAWMLTNWSSFDYSQIKFDQSEPVSLKYPFIPHLNGGVISFEEIEGIKYLNLILEIQNSALDAVIELGENTRLFKILFQ